MLTANRVVKFLRGRFGKEFGARTPFDFTGELLISPAALRRLVEATAAMSADEAREFLAKLDAEIRG